MTLDRERAERAVGNLARQLNVDITEAAAGILRVANANMERAIRVVSIERGYDPREFALVAFGGCGGLHSCEIAGELGIRAVIVPHHAGVLSALGMLVADAVRDYAAGVLGSKKAEEAFVRLERSAARESPKAEFERSADLRYAGQSYEVNVPWTSRAAAEKKFHAAHKKLYGYARPGQPVEIVTIRVRARTRVPALKSTTAGTRPKATNPVEKQRVWTGGRWQNLPVWPRAEAPRRPTQGPALITDYGSTTLIGPHWRYHVDRTGNLLLHSIR